MASRSKTTLKRNTNADGDYDEDINDEANDRFDDDGPNECSVEVWSRHSAIVQSDQNSYYLDGLEQCNNIDRQWTDNIQNEALR
ncbi:hypothetical protein KIN20_035619 [Parelaphostrongylus tenuis]|uniref:Uncharacterized protein n=1 Tax=Parelaphostrongylus tenuis TaxID=148309 RepID=A0AAD5RET1_PARTN|nr:hypothetical protein KIN20_035619 [Parelaphostrongylus tenuis]